MTEQIRLGMSVRASGGEPVGTVGTLVVDPQSEAPIYVVVTLDGTPIQETAVPVSLVERVTGEGVHLAVERRALESFPDYRAVVEEKERRQRRPPERLRQLLPPHRLYSEAATTRIRERSRSAQAVELRKGMVVQDRNRSPVGQVVGIVADPEGRDPTHLAVREASHPEAEVRLLPTDLVDYVAGSDVYLLVDGEYLAGLATSSPQP